MAHVLPSLPYATDALEPFYDKATLEIHHGKHHAAYVDKLNKAIEPLPELKNKTIEEILFDIKSLPPGVRQKVINNGGGHYNHSLFWSIMGPGKGGEPGGKIGDAIKAEFGSFAEFRKKFAESAMEHFGSGWTFLVQDADGRLAIRNYANQDCPISDRLKPLLLVDLWEHAYYLKWQNKKADWIETWWKMVDWGTVDKLYQEEPAWMAVEAE
jgi:Fe-Mn family superoxide dismutase